MANWRTSGIFKPFTGFSSFEDYNRELGNARRHLGNYMAPSLVLREDGGRRSSAIEMYAQMLRDNNLSTNTVIKALKESWDLPVDTISELLNEARSDVEENVLNLSNLIAQNRAQLKTTNLLAKTPSPRAPRDIDAPSSPIVPVSKIKPGSSVSHGEDLHKDEIPKGTLASA